MDWICSVCTFINSSDYIICTMCEQGYQLFSMDEQGYQLFSMNEHHNDSLNCDDQVESNAEEKNSFKSNNETEFDEEDRLLDNSHQKKDIYVRQDGKLLFNQEATDERKRSIARRKALDLQKLLKNSLDKLPTSSSTFSKNVGKSSTIGFSPVKFASKSEGHFNDSNSHTKGVNISATSTAEKTIISTRNRHITGANASTSASAARERISTLNANVTGVNISASATADGLNVAAGNLGVNGLEVAASASTSAAKVTVGNVDVTAASAGASLKVNGAGVTAGNVVIGGPSLAVSASIDGSFSFGNINLGLRPSLDVGFGFNLGIPFLSGSKMGASVSNSDNGNNNDGSQNPRGLEGVQQYLSKTLPNKRYYVKPNDVSIEPNTTDEPIDPLLSNERLERTDDTNSVVDNVVNRHDELVRDGKKFVGFKGGPVRNHSSTEQSNASSNEASQNPNSSSTTEANSANNNIWSGMYVSPSPEVAGGYAVNDDGHPGVINRVYLPKNSADVYYTKTGLETEKAKHIVKAVNEHSNGRYIFSGPQHSTDPDLRAPETVISPSVRDEALTSGNISFEQSAHQVNNLIRLETVYNKELERSQIVPDYLVTAKDASDCARDGGRERLGHVFQGRPPYHYDHVPQKPKEPSEDDKLLLEECKKLGLEIPLDSLEELKKNLRSDKEYECEEDAENRQKQTNHNNNANGGNSTENKEKVEEEVTEPPKPCKDHPSNVRCMKCMSGSSGPRIRRVHGQIYGFKFNN